MRVTVQRMAQGSTYHLHDRYLNGGLGALLLEMRAEKASAEDIAFRLRTDHDIRVSAATVLRWVGIAEDEAKAAAS